MVTASRVLKAHRTYFTNIRARTLGAGFFDDACKEYYLRRLLQCHRSFHVQVHAYVLLQKQIFLMVTPLTPSGFGAFTRFLSDSYNNYYSIRFERKIQALQNSASVSQLPSRNSILDCQKFIERYALKGENWNHAGQYRYSSYCANAFSLKPKLLTRHRAFKELLSERAGSLESYREFIATPFREEYEQFLRSRLLNGHSLLGKRIEYRLEDYGALTDIEKSVTITQTD